jgi:hypothetical protein
VLELLVAGRCVAVARAGAETLQEMSLVLGLEREGVRQSCEAALCAPSDVLWVAPPRPTDRTHSQFVSGYVLNETGNVTMGVVWYDVASNTTAPPACPAAVQRQMRFEVHRFFLPRSRNEPLLNALLEWDFALGEGARNVGDAQPAGQRAAAREHHGTGRGIDAQRAHRGGGSTGAPCIGSSRATMPRGSGRVPRYNGI